MRRSVVNPMKPKSFLVGDEMWRLWYDFVSILGAGARRLRHLVLLAGVVVKTTNWGREMRVSLVAFILAASVTVPAFAFDVGDARLLVDDGKCKKCDLTGVDLSGENLTGAYLPGADLSDANLSSADFTGADLIYTNMAGADLSDADLDSAKLGGADLTGADLSGADMTYAAMEGTILNDADLSGVVLTGADLSFAELEGATLDANALDGAILCQTKMPDGTRDESGC